VGQARSQTRLRPAFDPALASFSEKITLQTSWSGIASGKIIPLSNQSCRGFATGKRKNHCTDSMCVAGKTNA
jgi:hypothetical protein